MMVKVLLSLVLAGVVLAGSVCGAQEGRAAKTPCQVLRHLVLFKWKDGTTPEQVKVMQDGFVALSTKIDFIYDFEWGTDVSVEGKSQGFTDCYLVTFRSQADRDAYLPHPEHKAFVGVIGPYLDKVLVIDYWTKESATFKADKDALRHVVLIQWKEGTIFKDVATVENAFCALPGKIDAIHDFEWGTDNSPEGLAQGFTHCFMVTFATEADRAVYLPHPEHKAFGGVLGPFREQVLVVDYRVRR